MSLLHDKSADKIEADKRAENTTTLPLPLLLQLPFLFTFTLALTLTFTLGYFFRNRRFFILKPMVFYFETVGSKKETSILFTKRWKNIEAAVQKMRA